jgi:pyruvate/2-oxoglutarate dehydrogenase complex dihydrolipoamide dehydrogenase (E3) component
MTETVDVVVLGLGPGGEDVAGRLAAAGLQVVAIEAELVGGECPYWGCIPSKMVIRAADLLAEGRRIDGMSGDAEVHPSFAPVAKRIRDEATDTWDDTVAAKRLEGKGARLVRGWGRLDGPGRVVVGDLAFAATRAVVVGIGTRASIPPIPGLAETPYWTNREILEADVLPNSLAVLGGGAIGVELAQAVSRFGTTVTVVESAPRLVAQEEPEASELLETVLRREGIQVVVGAGVAGVRHELDRFVLDVKGRESVSAERLLVATGRRADLAGLGVASVGLEEGLRALPVDDHLRVEGVDRTWALGDVTGKGAFTHVSMYQADVVVHDVLGEPVTPADYRAVPRVTFSDPEIGSVGMTEQAARDAGIDVVVGAASVPSSARGWIHKAGNDGLIKLVGDAQRGVLVGATSMGPWGGEVLSLLTLAVHAEVPVTTLRHLHYAYPTFHRAIGDAVKDLLGED